MGHSPYVRDAARAVRMMKASEKLLARAGFYESAAAVRDQRENVAECSVQSVEDGRPKAGEYKPKTIGDVADERAS
jgi:hypothetical protein